MATKEELADALQNATEALANTILHHGEHMPSFDLIARKQIVAKGRDLYRQHLSLPEKAEQPITQTFTVELTRNTIYHEVTILAVDAPDEYAAAEIAYNLANKRELWIGQESTSTGGVDVEVSGGVSWREENWT